jgi:phosphopantetheine--protein transferase-like protein
MDTQAALRTAIAKIANVDESAITGDFSLDIPRFRSSAGSVILSNMVKKICKQSVNCAGVKTFGELLSLGNAVPALDSAVPVTATAAVPAETPLPDIEKPSAILVMAGMSCGIDIQDISIFPESSDYWVEPFYTDNFTEEEIAYCATAPFPRKHFASRWCVKESLRKNNPAFLALPFKSIQVKKQRDGSVSVEVYTHGAWRRINGTCSMSGSEQFAVGMVIVHDTPKKNNSLSVDYTD